MLNERNPSESPETSSTTEQTKRLAHLEAENESLSRQLQESVV